MTSMLRCASCGRTDGGDSNSVNTITYQRRVWCTSCADVKQSVKNVTYISMPSPGRMYEGSEDDPIDAWEDCYLKKIKKRILVKKAEAEIKRAWERWDEKKSVSDSMFFAFFCWLTRYRPYFLTFRCSGDPWQTVHSWLIQYEEQKLRRQK